MSIKDIFDKMSIGKKKQYDCIKVSLFGLEIVVKRITDPEIPHEVTVVTPRAELREKYDENNRLIEKEVILNSITVVHAPRHPLAGPPSPPPEIPARSVNFIPKDTKGTDDKNFTLKT
ncbi:hypothetical protein [Alkaliphilus hydrothermalis]|uniref:Uncharacterized protein n=1 Tax=Alkaliphilus hydrothermalis TaxID=1482730 RepID=A0ABS2NQH8_9FIRM|nr:hypothetical protein [Alkaliphilus hydrothermalis]MBM7615209.1 hypothetical protein [Alkaliphilus hydrothermalis]